LIFCASNLLGEKREIAKTSIAAARKPTVLFLTLNLRVSCLRFPLPQLALGTNEESAAGRTPRAAIEARQTIERREVSDCGVEFSRGELETRDAKAEAQDYY
jgi:hypothetical protein